VLIDGINNHNLENILFLYTQEAVHITAKETIQGKTAIRNWYERMLNGIYNNCSFTLSGLEGKDNNRHYSWMAKSSDGKNYTGRDSIGLQDGKIVYHYSSIILS
jgi:ketosteroid isomerase-like protein